MKERGIIFSGPMVRAILDGRKTMTRRVCKPQDPVPWKDSDVVCPYGQPGDRRWVRETHYRYGKWVKNGLTKTGRQRWRFRASGLTPGLLGLRYEGDNFALERNKEVLGWHKRPSIFMPCWASRITLEITGVKVERLQEISEEDAKREGVSDDGDPFWVPSYSDPDSGGTPSYKKSFNFLWASINKKHPWVSNPFIWAISFKRVRP